MNGSNGRVPIFTVAAVVLTAALSSLLTALYFTRVYEKPAFAPLLEMARTIEKNYYFADDTTNDAKLVDDALRGMIAGIGDVYAEYLTEAEYKELLAEDSAEYEGIGVSVSEPDDVGSLILKVYADSPAEEAGVRAGDVITVVNGKPIGALSLADMLKLCSTESGGSDTLTLQRGDEAYTVTVTRRAIHVPRVYYELLENGVGYIRIEEFAGDVVNEFADAISALTGQNADKLVIDLRNNPGGGLTEVLGTVEYVLDKGAVISTVRNRAGDEKVYKATKRGVDLPIAVLVNGYSASGSEMFSGAVQDNARGSIIGTQTFGKGIVQSYFRLSSNGGWVKITTDAYFTPSGVCIHGVGIAPDLTVELAGGKDEYVDVSTLDHADDAQLLAALAYLSGQNGGN